MGTWCILGLICFVIVLIGRLIDGLGSRMGLCPSDHLMTW